MEKPVPILIDNMTRFATIGESEIGSLSRSIAWALNDKQIESIPIDARWVKRLDRQENLNQAIEELEKSVKGIEKFLDDMLKRIPVIQESISFMTQDGLLNGMTLCDDYAGYREKTSRGSNLLVRKIPSTRYSIAKGTAGRQIGPSYELKSDNWPGHSNIKDIDQGNYRSVERELRKRIVDIEKDIKEKTKLKNAWLNILTKLKTGTPDQWVLKFSSNG